MRGIYTPVTDIRRKVFTEVARMSYESNEMADYAKEIRDLPFKIMPGFKSFISRTSVRSLCVPTTPSTLFLLPSQVCAAWSARSPSLRSAARP